MSQAQIAHIRSVFEKNGAKFPKPVAQAITDLDTLAAAGASHRVPSPEDLYAAAAEAILTGGEMLEDAGVSRIINAQVLAGPTGQALAYGLNQAGYQRIAAALTEHADTIISTLKETADTAGEVLSSSYDIIGDLDLTESEQILAKGPAAASAWAAAQVSAQTVRECSQAWFSLVEVTRITGTNLEPTQRLADLDLDTLEKVGRSADPWDIIRAGGTIDLATRTTARERSNRRAQALQERQDTNADAFRQEYRRLQGIG